MRPTDQQLLELSRIETMPVLRALNRALDLQLELDDDVAARLAGIVRAEMPLWVLLHNARIAKPSPDEAARLVLEGFAAGDLFLLHLE